MNVSIESDKAGTVQCEACAWWAALPVQMYHDMIEPTQGLCHRFPPQVIVLHVLTLTGEKK